MRLGLVGNDATTGAVAEAAAGLGHEVAWLAEVDSAACDAVVVARAADDDAQMAILRRLAQAAMPAVVTHPASRSMLDGYELDMIRRETGGVLLPYLPERWHPAIMELAALVSAGEAGGLGAVEQASFDRQLVERSKGQVIDQFARDVALVRAVCGEVRRIGAMGGSDRESQYANLQVQMLSDAGYTVRWSVSPPDEGPAGRLVVVGSRGRAQIDMPEGDAPWTLLVRSGDETTRRTFDEWQPAREMLVQLARAAAGQPIGLDWRDAARSVELAETIDRSLARGRTIELHNEDFSEEGTFKGVMTSLGCGYLVLGMFLLGLAAIVGQEWFTVTIVGLLLGLAAAFLGLQALGVIARRDDAAEKRTADR